MGKTTFTGPIRAGNILNTSGTTLGQDVRNVGSVVMAQVFAVTQTTTSGQATGVFRTDIVLPANSHILNIQLMVTTAWTTGTTTIDVGTTAGGAELVSAGAGGTIGVIGLNPGSDATRTANWDDTGTADRRIWIKSNGGVGSGVGTLTVRYIQAHDLP
jgi:hypothetical protein